MLSLGKFLCPDEAAIRLNVSRDTLQRWRMRGTGPRFVRVGGLIRYPEQYLDDWIRQQTTTPPGGDSNDV